MTFTRFALYASAVSACCLPTSLRAQGVPVVEAGLRVRVIVVGAREWQSLGRVVLFTADSLVLARDDSVGLRRYSRDSIAELELSMSRKGRAFSGFTLGALVGAATGAAIGYASGDYTSCSQSSGASDEVFTGCLTIPASQKAIIGGVGLGVVGGIAGAILGASHHSDDWVILSRHPSS